ADGEAVVLDDEDHREAVGGGEAEGVVEVALAGRPLAGGHHRDRVLATDLGGECDPGGVDELGGDHRPGGDDVEPPAAEVGRHLAPPAPLVMMLSRRQPKWAGIWRPPLLGSSALAMAASSWSRGVIPSTRLRARSR